MSRLHREHAQYLRQCSNCEAKQKLKIKGGDINVGSLVEYPNMLAYRHNCTARIDIEAPCIVGIKGAFFAPTLSWRVELVAGGHSTADGGVRKTRALK